MPQFPLSRLALSAAVLALPYFAVASATDYTMTNDIVHLPLAIKVLDKGSIEADAKNWKVEHDAEGTDLYTAKSGDESRVAAMKTKDGNLESFTSYVLKAKAEISNTVFFEHGKLSAYTTCEDEASGKKDSVGRICVTATPKLCQNLKKNDGIEPETLKELDLFEMRALAAILTLRGSDHQLENVVKSGNRLGLKTSLQTTKGQIYALVKQINKETSKSPASDAPKSDDDKLARTVLEKSLPRLKEACTVTKF